jgi:2'-5' RNA ligase
MKYKDWWFNMAMIAIPVPAEVSSLLKSMKIPGSRDASDHITLFYLGDNIDIKTINKCLKACLKITEKTKPFLVNIEKCTNFPEGKHGFPIICPVENKEIFKLHEKLTKVLDRNKVEYSKKFPEFKPHLTLSYHNEELPEQNFSRICWQVRSISIYGGDSGKERIYAELSFGSGENNIKKSSEYIYELCNNFHKLSTIK